MRHQGVSDGETKKRSTDDRKRKRREGRVCDLTTTAAPRAHHNITQKSIGWKSERVLSGCFVVSVKEIVHTALKSPVPLLVFIENRYLLFHQFKD